jgi:excinuclease UvrABC ATPase subunit
MPVPRMVIVAGPSGGGKSSLSRRNVVEGYAGDLTAYNKMACGTPPLGGSNEA